MDWKSQKAPHKHKIYLIINTTRQRGEQEINDLLQVHAAQTAVTEDDFQKQ